MPTLTLHLLLSLASQWDEADKRSGTTLWATAKQQWREGPTGNLHATAIHSYQPVPDGQAAGPGEGQLQLTKGELLDVLEPPGPDWTKVSRSSAESSAAADSGSNTGYVPTHYIRMVHYAPVYPGEINAKALLEAHMLEKGVEREDVEGFDRMKGEVMKTVIQVFDDGPFLYELRQLCLLCINMPALDRSLSDCRYDCYNMLDGNGDGLVTEDELRHWIYLLTGHDRGSHLLDQVSKNDEFCVKNKELCIKNKEMCIKNDEFCSAS